MLHNLWQGQYRHTLSPPPLPKGEGIQGMVCRFLHRLRGRVGEGAACLAHKPMAGFLARPLITFEGYFGMTVRNFSKE